MKEIQLYLVSSPNAPPDFLATVQPVLGDVAAESVNDVKHLWNSIKDTKIVLEGYTRDGWAWKPIAKASSSSSLDEQPILTTIVVESIDGRNKLPGFVNYLKERQKSAYGRFNTTGVWIVSYVQPKLSATTSVAASNVNTPRIQVHIALDHTRIPNCTLPVVVVNGRTTQQQQQQQSAVPKSSESQSSLQRSSQNNATTNIAPTKSTSDVSGSSGGTGGRTKTGLLGKLMGAQQRTNHYVAIAATVKKPSSVPNHPTKAASSTSDISDPSTVDDGGDGNVPNNVEYKTVAEVFAEFRQKCQDVMLDFDMSNDEVLHVPLRLHDHTKNLATMEEKSRVTMDVMKYMIYEAAEEVNEEWIAYKEPSEFMDEVTIAIYKEGAAPPEVLEEINKGELPDEIRGQQRAIQEQRLRAVNQAEMKLQQQLHQKSIQNDGDEDEDELEVLNTKKRDRRTIEDYEREKLKQSNSNKRSR